MLRVSEWVGIRTSVGVVGARCNGRAVDGDGDGDGVRGGLCV